MAAHLFLRLSCTLWLASAARLWAAHAQFTTYPVSTVQQSASLPQDDLTTYLESFCFCDVTAYSCDSNCCCDDVCDSTAVALFSTCLPTQPLTPELLFCINEDVVSTVSSAYCLPMLCCRRLHSVALFCFGRASRVNGNSFILFYLSNGQQVNVQVSLPASGSLSVFKRKASGDSLTRSLLCIVDENNPTFATFFEGASFHDSIAHGLE